jgi:hypothetical protein
MTKDVRKEKMLAILNKTIHDYMYSYEDFLFTMREKLGDYWDDYIEFRNENSDPAWLRGDEPAWLDGDE